MPAHRHDQPREENEGCKRDRQVPTKSSWRSRNSTIKCQPRVLGGVVILRSEPTSTPDSTSAATLSSQLLGDSLCHVALLSRGAQQDRVTDTPWLVQVNYETSISLSLSVQFCLSCAAHGHCVTYN